jgi:hypothetical protein
MRSFYVFLFGLCLYSCTDRESVPPGIIKPDSMQAILKDVVAADLFATQYLLKDSLRKDSVHRNVKLETLQLYETIFKLHRVTKDEFRKSMDFYASRPDLEKQMFDSLSADETRSRTNLYKPKSIPVPLPKDSLKHVLHPGNSLKHVPQLKDSLRTGSHP